MGVLVYILHTLIIATYFGDGDALLRFSNSIGNHMVLQKAPESALLWGYSDVIGDTVTILIDDVIMVNTTTVINDHQSNTDSSGSAKWKVKLPPESRVGPHVITATSSKGNVTIYDVMFGDVWICSGQSNMQFKMSEVYNHTAEIEDSLSYPNIRMLFSKLVSADTQQDDVILQHSWTEAEKATRFPISFKTYPIPKQHISDIPIWTIDDYSALCFMFARDLQRKLNYPIGLIESNWGGTSIETWSSQDVIKKCKVTEFSQGFWSPATPSVLWNAMIHPYLQTTIKGVIWYQGEANRDHPDIYNCLFPTMIEDWREKFNAGSMGATPIDFPFGFVQLAPWRTFDNLTYGFPGIRWSQTAGVGYVPNKLMPNTFMAVAVDLPDMNSPSGSIHPRYKQEIAARLALGAENVAYGDQSVVFQAPFPTQYLIHASDRTLEVMFSDGNAKLTTNNDLGFEICCTTMSCSINSTGWLPARITQHTLYSVTLDISGCQAGHHVGAVRYLWLESPCAFLKCPIYGQTNYLPVPPFIQHGPFNVTSSASIVG